MSVGLIALLDDVAAMAKLAAASIDDVGAAATRAGAKAAGVVIDDAAVTPRYVTGLSPDRELPIIWRIAVGSARNKLLLLLPLALALSAFAPWALTPLLMLGGLYLCFEGAEKVIEKLLPHQAHAIENTLEPQDPVHLERSTISGAIRTDLILSAEIMAIALATVAAETFWAQTLILIVVSLAITAGVYGVVALIVKLDDIGLHLCRRSNGGVVWFGRLLVKAMPRILALLALVGTAAMLLVGGGILAHGLEELGVHVPGHQIEAAVEIVAHGAGSAGDVLGWITGAALHALTGIVLGGLVALAVGMIAAARRARKDLN